MANSQRLDQFTAEELLELDDRFDTCEHGRKLRCDDCLSREWDKGRKDGFENGFQWAIAQVRERAGKAFTEGKDERAIALRDLANVLVDVAVKAKLIPEPRQR